MKQLLSHSSTKDELTAYLAPEVLHHAADNGKCIVVAWRNKAETSHREVNLGSSQEEADTKLLLHAVHATNEGARSVRIYSPDTDVLVLAIRRYPNLAEDTCMVTGTGKKKRTCPHRSNI